MTNTRNKAHSAATGSRLLLTAMLLTGSSLAMAQTAPIVQPGAPGQASKTLTADEATELAKASFTDADIRFMQMMIPHHQSAIDMAEVELEHGSDAETREMARQIIDAQKGEIADMRAMLQRMGVEAPE